MKNNKFRNSKGFSLVELLVAVAILGIVVVPLLHSFVTSANTAAKSRKLGEVTLLAKNVAELVNATDMNDINVLSNGKSLGAYSVSGFSAHDVDNVGNNVLHTDANSTASKYAFALDGLGNGKYSAVVSLDADTNYSDTNSVDITQYTPMGAVFNQTSGSDPDILSRAHFELKAAAITDIKAGTTITLSYTRQILVNIIEASSEVCTYTCNYKYLCVATYTSSITNNVETLNWEDSYETTFFDGSPNDDGSLPSIYFFFNSYYPNADDIITITHDGTAPVSVFIACQGNNTYPSAAKAHIRLKDESYITNRELGTKVFCNIPRGSYLFYIFENNYWYISTTYSESLYDTKQENRIYDLSVSIYETGSTEPLYTLSTTKLD